MVDFDRARDEYLSAMRRVPPDALGYLRPGDDYSVGGIAVHVNYVLEHYLAVLGTMIAAGFRECRATDPDGLEERSRRRAGAALDAGEVAAELERTGEFHRQVVEVVEGLGREAERKAPVWYSGGSEPYPTSAQDVVGWLTDHYHEHVPQLAELAAEAEARA